MQDSCSSGDPRSKVWRPQKGRDPWSCSSGDLRSKPLGKGQRKMTQVGGHEKKRTVRSKFARKSTTKVQELDWRIAQKGPFFQKTRRKHRKGCKQRENFRPQAGTYKKLCDRCKHRPNRRVKCRICKRSVGPCCLATDEPDPYCKDCWEPDPEQTRIQRNEVFQPKDPLNQEEEGQK